MRKFTLLLVVSIISLSAFAGFVPRKDAEKVAKSHYYQNVASIKAVDWENVQLNCMFDPSENDNFNFYVFNVNGDEGYVVISSESKIQPILAYSFEGGFNHNNMSPGQREFLEYFEDCIDFAITADMEPSEKAANDWNELIHYTPEQGIKEKSTSPNLLKLINWNQSWPYNAQCPEDAAGIHGHVPVGCVATAMLQLMKYYNWPPTGTSSKYHSSWMNGGYGNININFGASTYDWYSIPNEATALVNEELGEINFHAGVAVSMQYGPTGSGSFTDRIENALEDYFRFSTSTQYVMRSNYSETNWKNLIIDQIDSNIPLVYSGNSSTSGHAWNCDGYNDDEFHMNWGWGGAGNGYYSLNDLTSTATAGGPENNFNLNNDMIINAYPEGTYPLYCPGLVTINGPEGSFGDGSSSNDYESNTSCVYVIKPTCGASVSVDFNEFNVGSGDIVTIFDGDETSTNLLATFDEDNLPGNDNIYGTSGSLTVKFDTDGSSNDEGWNLNYKVRNCKTNIHYEDASGTISDGSGVCEYSNSTVCSWYIQPDNVSRITIDFDNFDLAENLDYVKIFKTNFSSANLVVKYSIDNLPDGPLSIDSDIVTIQFFADANDVGDGWSLNYTSSLSDVEDNIVLNNFTLMPNPGNLNSRLVFTLTEKTDAKIFVTNLLGEVIAIENFNLMSGVHELTLSEIVKTNLEAGVYTVCVEAQNQLRTQKLIVIE